MRLLESFVPHLPQASNLLGLIPVLYKLTGLTTPSVHEDVKNTTRCRFSSGASPALVLVKLAAKW